MLFEIDQRCISSRFCLDGESATDLSDEQVVVRDQIQDNIDTGEYKIDWYPCTLCESKTRFVTLAEKGRYGIGLPVQICRKCGLVQTNPRLTDKSAGYFYGDYYRKLYGLEQNKDSRFNNQYQNAEKIYEYINSSIEEELSNLSIFEVGCGYGGLLWYFKERGCKKVQGCEIDGDAAEYAKARGLDVIETDIANSTLDYDPDIIIFDDVLEHLVEPKNVIEYVSNIQDNGSYVYIELPGIKRLSPLHRANDGDFLKYIHIAHTHHFSARTLSMLMRQINYYPINIDKSIKSLFEKNEEKHAGDIESDYESVTKHLEELETYNKLGLNKTAVHIQSVGSLLSGTIIVDIMKKIGVYKYVKNVYFKFI